MSFTAEPIHIAPRMLPRRWGREGAPAWCAGWQRPPGRIGEIWLAHSNNVTRDGVHLSELIAEAPQEMLGQLGRAPPSLRLILTDEPSDQLRTDGPVSLWGILESPLDGVMSVQDRADARERTIKARRGALLRADGSVGIRVGPTITALEARANFSPTNAAAAPRLRGVARANDNAQRSVWFRDAALSVELWTLPEISFLEPDGETCHVLVALTPGISFNGQSLSRGDAILLPAEGRRAMLTGRGAQMLAAYPDMMPTQIWRCGRPPAPAALAIDPGLLGSEPREQAHAFDASRPGEMRAAA